MNLKFPTILFAAALAGACADPRGPGNEEGSVGRGSPFEGLKAEVKDPDSPTGVAPAPSDGRVKERSCEAEPAQVVVGKGLSAPVAEEARRLAGATRLRVIRPGEAVTEDFSEVRLNIVLDGANRVVRLHCG